MTSLWLTSGPTTVPGAESLAHEPVSGRYDVAVVGAGLTGLATALLLARAGAAVVVLEARYVGAGTTGHSTAKVSLLQGTRLSSIARQHGPELVGQYVTGNRVGQEWLLEHSARHEVGVQRRAAVTYAAGPQQLPAAEEEHAVALAAGLPVEWRATVDAPFQAVAGTWLPEQAQVDPVAVLGSLLTEARAAGVDVRTGARVTDAHGSGSTVVTGRGTVQADRVVLATGVPIADRGGYFARLEPQRSYALALAVQEPTGLQMSITAGSPTRSVRTAPTADGEVVLVGGAGHVVGRAESPQARVDNLLSWAQQWLPGARVLARWSAQDYHPVDELPYVGPLLPRDSRVLVATGFAKWGMTNAVAAAHVIAGQLTDTPPAWGEAYRSWSRHETSGLLEAVRLNAGVAAHMAGGYARALTSTPPAAPDRAGEPAPEDGDPGQPDETSQTQPDATTQAEPAAQPDETDRAQPHGAAQPGGAAQPDAGGTTSSPVDAETQAPREGAGRVVRRGLHPVGVSTVDGVTREVSAICPHLGGVLCWNDEERSWDCPLHGSRFAADGTLLEGPATRDLQAR